MGAYAGGYMARGGQDVTLVDPWPANVERLRTHGLRLSGLSAEECFTTDIAALHVGEVQQLSRRPADIVFLCMKSYDTAWATMLIKDYLAPSAFVVSLQNCINEPTIAAVVGWGRTLGCIASNISVELSGPGDVRRGVPRGDEHHKVFRVGEVHGRITPRVKAVAELVGLADNVIVTANLWGERWSKLVLNAMGNGVSAASGLTSNACDREAVTRWLAIRLAGEAVRVGTASGFELEAMAGFAAEDWVKAMDGDASVRAAIEDSMLESTHTRGEDQRPSMAQDVDKGRRTEIDDINGVVMAKARELGIETPANAGLHAVVKRIEQGSATPSLDLLRDI